MAGKKKPKQHRQPWSKADLKTLKSMVKAKNSVGEISKAMSRTEAAIRHKAFMEGVSFRAR